MKKYMIAHYRITGSFQDVEQAIRQVVPEFKGWALPIPDWEFYKSQLSKGFSYYNMMYFGLIREIVKDVAKTEAAMKVTV